MLPISESHLTRDEMEVRRLAAAQDLLAGVKPGRVARKFGVSRTTSTRWARSLKYCGADSLKKRKATGRPSRLSAEQLQALPDIIAQGPIIHGFPDNRWTALRVAIVIDMRFNVRYHQDHVWNLLKKLGLKLR